MCGPFEQWKSLTDATRRPEPLAAGHAHVCSTDIQLDSCGALNLL